MPFIRKMPPSCTRPRRVRDQSPNVDKSHSSCQRTTGLPSTISIGSQTWRLSAKFFGYHTSNMAMNFPSPSWPGAGMAKVLWAPKVMSAPMPLCGLGPPTHGLPSGVHSPSIESATADRAGLGAQPVRPLVTM